MLATLKVLLSCIAVFCLSIVGKPTLHEYKINGLAQGTTYAVRYFANDSLVTQLQIDSILKVIDESMSLYKENSTINKFNRSASGLTIDPHFAKVVEKSIQINQETKGLFDVTVAPLVQLWGFGPKKIDVFPDSAAIKAVMPCIGMDKIKLTNTYLSKSKSCINIDLNGIAQGYSVDVVAALLLAKNISTFVVEIGGELRVKGPKPNGEPMRIGIEGPSENTTAEPIIKHVMTFNEGAVTTSGNYRKYLNNGNRKISHLIDPSTGYSLQNEMISVTVFAKDAITADGYDNALMAMHVDEALSFVAAKPDVEAYIIYKKPNGKIADTLSQGFKKLIIDLKQ